MGKLRLAGIAGLTIAAVAIPSTTAYADTFLVRCPDNYVPVPVTATPPGGKDKNKNGNLFVCAKGPQGSNEHFNIKDDHGEVVPPNEWNVTAIGPMGSYLVHYGLATTGTYTIDPAPSDFTDDL